jgi:diguanylate cyclase (GGDEF)-like protein
LPEAPPHWRSNPHTPGHFLYAALAIIFTLYIVRASRVVHTDYWNALGNRKLLEDRASELEVLSVTDALTQLRNRLYFDAQFELEWKRAFRQRSALTIVLLDLDHFKRINDGYGHAFGDLCLQEASKVLAAEVSRSGDVLARYGGEEFIVLLSNTADNGAAVVAERLLQAVRSIEVKFGGERVPVTCSIGVASGIPVTADRGFRLINEADKALYQAKQSGRDRIVFASPAMIDTMTFTAVRSARE